MELPRRQRGDELLKPGRMLALRERLRRLSTQHDLTTVIACAFDHRTRMLPFIFADTHMAPAGVRAVGSAMADVGFPKTRIVLQQWNKKFRPSKMQLDGRVPDVFMVSSMQIHTAACWDLIRDVCKIEPAHRPLVIAGGAKTIYEPWDVFSGDSANPASADVAVTGEEYVLLSLLEVILSIRNGHGTLREAFIRARNSGLLDGIPGLVYARTRPDGSAEELVDTGVQQLVGDLDELPDPVPGYAMLEPPSREETLGSKPLPANKIRKYSQIGSLVLTFGCKFACSYCPIPAYNQRQHRVKSGERIAEEIRRLNQTYGLREFFGADDNFFNQRERTLDIVETLARQKSIHRIKKLRWGTEATVHDTLELREHLPVMRKAGLRALWIGVEDMTATLVKKGQSVNKTIEAFKLLQKNGIMPMPMMMHHDSQPLYTRGKPYGLINQARMLRKAGAITLQVLMITPATGSKYYENTFESGMVYDSVDGRHVDTHMLDGNYVVASNHPQPWRKQLNMMTAYLYFYNPLRFMLAVVRSKSKLYFADAGFQFLGMMGLAATVRRTFGWMIRLVRGKVVRRMAPPRSAIPMRAVQGGTASHALPGTPLGGLVQLTISAPALSDVSQSTRG